jgi:hypothetical protein
VDRRTLLVGIATLAAAPYVSANAAELLKEVRIGYQKIGAVCAGRDFDFVCSLPSTERRPRRQLFPRWEKDELRGSRPVL